MDNAIATGWNCFGSPAATLPPLERQVVRVLRDARGIYRTGVTVEHIWRVLTIPMTRKPKLTAQRRERVELALARIEAVGLPLQPVGANKWRMGQ